MLVYLELVVGEAPIEHHLKMLGVVLQALAVQRNG